MSTEREFDLVEDSIIGLPPPDRSTSASAPPALELATESLFAFSLQYANIFSDIRANDDYAKFYETHRQEKKLPLPLDPAPFLFDAFEPTNGFANAAPPTEFASNGIWAPLPRKQPNLTVEPFREDLRTRLQTESLNDFSHLGLNESNYSSSPSAQTAFKSAQYIWNDEEVSSNGTNQSVFPPKKIDTPIKVDKVDVGKKTENGTTEDDELSPRSNVICRYYAGGYCSRGDKCFYSHDTTVQTPSSEQQEKDKQSSKSVKNAKNKSSRSNQSPTKHTTPSKQQKDKDNHLGSNHLYNNKENGYKENGHKENTKEPHHPSSYRDNTPKDNHNSTSPFKDNHRENGNGASSGSDDGEFYTSLDQLIGKVYLVSRDQQGCRFLQKKLEEEDPLTVETIFNEVFDHMTELMTDPFGNYLCQKLLEHCNDQQRLMIVSSVSKDLVTISKNMHGTRAVQKMIECLSSPAQVNHIVQVLSSYVVDLIQDLNGNHVIQRCLNRLTPKDNQFIYDAVTSGNNCVQVATHRHGCCVLQRCIDHGSEKQKVQLIQEITKNALTLVQDPYGNYVVQYVLELPFPMLVDSLAQGFLGHIRQLATQKFSSNVIEKCLSLATPHTTSTMIREILQGDNLYHMLSDPFANYVVQTALSVADTPLHLELVEAIRPHLQTLRNTPYGKRIQSRISKETAERAHRKEKLKNHN